MNKVEQIIQSQDKEKSFRRIGSLSNDSVIGDRSRRLLKFDKRIKFLNKLGGIFYG